VLDDHDDDDPDRDDEDTGEALCSPIDFFRQLPQGDPDDLTRAMVRKHDRDQAERKIQTWLDEVMSGSDD